MSSGGVLVNDTLYHYANCCTPFGGVGNSGVGNYHGKFSYECFSHKKSVLRRDDHMIFDIPIRYPPYTPMALTIFKLACSLPSIPYVSRVQLLVSVALAVLIGVYGKDIGTFVSMLSICMKKL